MAYPQNPIAVETMEILRTRAGLTSGDTSRDTEIVSAWYQARLILAGYLNRSLYIGTHTDDFICQVSRILSLAAYPVNSVTSVIVDAAIEVDDYTLSASNGLIYLPRATCAKQITVTYEATPPEDDLFMSALLWSFSGIWAERYGDDSAARFAAQVKAVSIDGMRSEYFDANLTGALDVSGNGGGYPVSISAMLSPYRRWNS